MIEPVPIEFDADRRRTIIYWAVIITVGTLGLAVLALTVYGLTFV